MLLFLFLTANGILSTNGEKLACRISSPTLNQCAKNSLNKIIPSLAKGWAGLPALDPLKLPSLESQFDNENLTLSLSLDTREVALRGLATAKVHAIKSKNLYMGKLEIVTKIPNVVVTGKYSTEGIISTFPLSSHGPFNITMDDMTVVWIIYLERYHVQPGLPGRRLAVSKMWMDAVPEEIHILPAAQLDGDDKLGKALEIYLNQNSFELYNMIKPTVMKFITGLAKDLVNMYLATIPDEDVFSPS